MRQRKCKKIVPMLEDFRRGSLTPEETKVVKTHLAGCPSCRTTLTDTGRLVALLQKEVRVDPEPAFWEGLKNRIMTEVRHHSEKGPGPLGHSGVSADSSRSLLMPGARP